MDCYETRLHQFPQSVITKDQKKKEDSLADYLFWEESSSIPPSYESIFGQFKETKEENGNSLEFFKRAVAMVVSTVGCTLSLTLLLALPMSMIIIGAKFKDDCPVEPFIPIYLIIGGAIGILKTIIEIIRRVTQNGDIFSSEEKEETTSAGVPQQTDDRSIAWVFFDGIISLFLFSWFIAGNIWVYSKYKPNFVAPTHEPLNYCNKTLYMFAFWVITASYLILGMICFCTCCLGLCASCTALFVTSANNTATQQQQQTQ